MISRRQFIKDSGLVLLGTALGYATLDTSCNKGKNPVSTTPPPHTDLAYLINVDPATISNSNLPLTPISGLHVNSSEPDYPRIDIADYSLTISGLVDNPLEITYEKFLTYERINQTTLLSCPDEFVDNPQWGGVSVATLLTAVGVKPEAQTVTFHAISGYSRDLPIADALAGEILLADKVDGVILPVSHGFPLRLIRPHVTGAYWVKWVVNMQVK